MFLTLVFTALIGCLLLTACSSRAPAQQSYTGEKIRLTDFNDRTVELNGVPQRISALSSGETNIIYALGGTLVGRPATDVPFQFEAAYDAFEIGTTHDVDLEKVAFTKPDVVLAHNIMNAKDVGLLENIGAKVILTSGNSVDDIKKQIELFGSMLQQEQKATEWITKINEKLASFEEIEQQTVPALIVYGAPGTFMAALPHSLSGNILELAGGENIAANYPQLQSYPQYAALDMERIAESNPQVVFIITHANPENVKQSFLDEMNSNAAWSKIAAVANNRVEVLPGELFGSNPGTRIIESMDYMYDMLHLK